MRLWQGKIMDKKIHEMAKIREEIQSKNQKQEYSMEDMPKITKKYWGNWK